MQYIVTVDIGTTSTKTIAFDPTGTIHAKESIGYPIISTLPDYAEQSPDIIFNAVLEGIRRVILKMGDEVQAISFSSAMHSLILVNEAGDPLTNVIIWADNRSKTQSENLRNTEKGLSIYLQTGTPIHPMSPLCKLLWFREFENRLFNEAYKFISIKEYVFFKLFGVYVIDYSVASATGLFNIYNLTWNKESLDLIGIQEDRLSKPAPVTFFLNSLRSEYFSMLGLKQNVPFVLGGSDGCLANLGSNATKTGMAAVTIGTSGAIRIACRKSKPDVRQRVFNYLLEDDVFIVGGPVNNGAILLEWFKENFMKGDFDTEDDFYDWIEKTVSRVEIGADDLVFLPYLLGERAPIWDANAKGVFFGLTLKHNKEHFARAIMESVIYAVYSVGKTIEELVDKIETISAGGGFARSTCWLQMLADVFNKKIVVYNSSESSSLGAAMIGFKAIGVSSNLHELQNYIEITAEHVPDINNHTRYMKHFSRFESLYHLLKEEFKKLG